MSTINNTITLRDGMSPVLSAITRRMTALSSTMERVARTTDSLGSRSVAASGKLSAIGRGIDLTQAEAAIKRIKENVAGIKDKTITVRANTIMATNAITKLNSRSISQKTMNVTSRGGSKKESGISGAISGAFGQFTAANLAANAITSMVTAVLRLPSALMAASDQYSGIQARIRLITSDVAGMNEQIYQSALRSRGSYSQMADTVSKLGLMARDAFPNQAELVPFVENIQKVFTIGGTGMAQQQAALLQLSQAMGSGKLQGDEFRSIAEAAPMLQQIVARYMRVSQGELKALSTEGKITAEIIKNAMLGATTEIEEKFKGIPITWEQSFQNLGTIAYKGFAPVYSQISAIANSPITKNIFEGLGAGAQIAGVATAGLINNVRWITGELASFHETFSAVFEYIGGFAISAITVYGVAWGVANLQVAISAIAHWATVAAMIAQNVELGIAYVRLGLVAVATAAWTLVTKGMTAALVFLNLTMLSTPIGWVIVLVGAIIAAFGAWVVVTRGLRNTVADVFTFIMNIVESSTNYMIGFINGLITALNKASQGMNNVFGTDLKNIDLVKKITLQDKTTAIGKAIREGKFLSPFGIDDKIPKENPLPDVPGYGSGPSDVKIKGGKLDKDQEIQISEESLKILTDLAQREVQLNYQQITPQFNISFGDIRETADADEVLDRIERKMIDIYEGNLGTATA